MKLSEKENFYVREGLRRELCEALRVALKLAEADYKLERPCMDYVDEVTRIADRMHTLEYEL